MIVCPEAEADLVAAQNWYDQQRDGLGAEFLEEVRVVFRRIEQTPAMHAVVYKDVRRAIVRRFPYLVFYRTIGDDVEV